MIPRPIFQHSSEEFPAVVRFFSLDIPHMSLLNLPRSPLPSVSKHQPCSSVSCGDGGGEGGYIYTLVKPTSPDLSIYFLLPGNPIMKLHNAADPAAYSFPVCLPLHPQDQNLSSHLLSLPPARCPSLRIPYSSSCGSRVTFIMEACWRHTPYNKPSAALARHGQSQPSVDKHQADAKDKEAASVQLHTHVPCIKVDKPEPSSTVTVNESRSAGPSHSLVFMHN